MGALMFKVFIPSMSRVGKITTHNFFNECFIVVPEKQKKDYEKQYDNVIGCPDNIKGITRTRNFILKYCKENNIKYHLQIDDDVRYFYYDEKNTKHKLTSRNKKDIFNIYEKLFIITEDWGFKIFGGRMREDKKDYREYSPYSTLCPVVANCIGIIDNDLFFDENLPIKEDYDYSLQHIHRYGGVIRANKYGVSVPHLINAGGCSEYRSKRMEFDVLKKMQKKWGKNVIRRSHNKNIMSIKVPIKGI